MKQGWFGGVPQIRAWREGRARAEWGMPPNFRRYLSELNREAFGRAWAQIMGGAAINIVVAMIGVVATVAALWELGSHDAASDEVIGSVAVASGCFSIFVGQYIYWLLRIPWERHDADKLRIKNLEQQLLPQLEFAWTSDSVKEVYGPGSPTYIAGKLGQIIVRNKSTSESARSVEVSLLTYINLDYENEVWIDASVFADSAQQLGANLNPGRHDRFNLFRVKYGAGKLMLGPFASQRRNNLESGRYKLTIITSSEQGRSVQEQCFLRFDGYERVEFRKWDPSDDRQWSNLTQYDGSLSP